MKSLFTQLFTLILLAGALQAHQTYTVDAKNSSVYYKSLADILFFIDTTIISINQSVSGQINVKYSDFGIKRPTVAGFITKATESIKIGATIRFVKTK